MHQYYVPLFSLQRAYRAMLSTPELIQDFTQTNARGRSTRSKVRQIAKFQLRADDAPGHTMGSSRVRHIQRPQQELLQTQVYAAVRVPTTAIHLDLAVAFQPQPIRDHDEVSAPAPSAIILWCRIMCGAVLFVRRGNG